METRDNGGQYSTLTGIVYISNLIVGTGALALPGAFSQAGWLLGSVLVCVLGLASLITVTFILETLAVVNAVSRTAAVSAMHVQNSDEETEATPLCGATEAGENQMFDITEKYEVSKMGDILLSKPSRWLVFVCLAVYLFGDLSIYCAVVARTLSHVSCTFRPHNATCNETLPDDFPCWDNHSLTRSDAYRVFVFLFTLSLGPFVFFNVQKTKFLQLLTSGMRWLAFIIMISWSIHKLWVQGPQGSVSAVNIYGVPTLFGTCVYSFMCQHSIPSLIQPIANKTELKKSLSIDYVFISLFYLLLSITAIFAFHHVEALYTLNFWPDDCNNPTSNWLMFLDYYLALFPVFTLSTSFPIVGITLRNNLKLMFLEEGTRYNYFVEDLLFPIITIMIPLTLALLVSNLQVLVSVIGSYAGAGVQYLIPCIFVTSARSHMTNFNSPNPYTSPFNAKYWVIALYFWMTISLVFITIKYVTDFV